MLLRKRRRPSRRRAIAWRRIACGILTVAAVLTVTSCRAREQAAEAPIKATVAVTNLPASAPVYVAYEMGFFREEGLDITMQRHAAGRLALQATLEGEADFATVADTPIVRSVLDGDTPVVVATIAEVDSANVIVARRDRGIANAPDLIGKRVGVLSGTSADFFLHIYLVTSGIDEKQVEVLPMKPEEIASAVEEGRVDAICAFAPYTDQAVKALGENALVLDQPGLYTLFWNVTVRAEYSRNDRETITRFLRAVSRGIDYVEAEPEAAQRITARGAAVERASLARQWSDNRWGLELTQPLILTLEDEARWMSGRDLSPNFLRHIDTGPMRRVHPQGVTIIEVGE